MPTIKYNCTANFAPIPFTLSAVVVTDKVITQILNIIIPLLPLHYATENTKFLGML